MVDENDELKRAVVELKYQEIGACGEAGASAGHSFKVLDH
jgi:hypothetical protein